MLEKPSGHRLGELDGLRGIACGMIVVLHCLMGPADLGILFQLRSAIAPLVAGGVDLFFVLSGFLIGGILMDNRGAQNYFTVFYARRVLRIFPVYFLLIVSYVIVLAVGSGRPAFDAWLLLYKLPTWSYFFFVQNYFAAATFHVGSYWTGITWSLAIEEQFYLVVPLLVFLLNRRQLVRLAIGCVALAILVRCWPGATYNWVYFFTPSRIDSLMAGVLVACIVRDERALRVCRVWRPALDAIALALIVAIVGLSIPDWLGLNIPAWLELSMLATLFAYAILRIFLAETGWWRTVLRLPGLVWLGGISYPLYMYHQAVNGMVHGFLFGGAPYIASLAQLMAAGAVIVIAIILATLSTQYYERPFMLRGWALRYSYRDPFPLHPRHQLIDAGIGELGGAAKVVVDDGLHALARLARDGADLRHGAAGAREPGHTDVSLRS
jgi:peptidoglycan/LPS O-acetylase OafA/YrhL